MYKKDEAHIVSSFFMVLKKSHLERIALSARSGASRWG